MILENSVETTFNAEIAETQRSQRKIQIHPMGERYFSRKTLPQGIGFAARSRGFLRVLCVKCGF